MHYQLRNAGLLQIYALTKAYKEANPVLWRL